MLQHSLQFLPCASFCWGAAVVLTVVLCCVWVRPRLERHERSVPHNTRAPVCVATMHVSLLLHAC